MTNAVYLFEVPFYLVHFFALAGLRAAIRVEALAKKCSERLPIKSALL